jgi:hypothetical protein
MSMKSRHATALALFGWYLMIPPGRSQQDSAPDADAPFNEWSIQASFDTAVECEKERNKFRSGVHIKAGQKLSSSSMMLLDMECIASDDPRLKEK